MPVVIFAFISESVIAQKVSQSVLQAIKGWVSHFRNAKNWISFYLIIATVEWGLNLQMGSVR